MNSLRLVLLALLLAAASLHAQLRIVDYNTAGDARAGIGTIFAAIGAESVNGIAKAPDVISLQEQDSSASTTQNLVNILNAIYGAGTYARATLDGGTSGAGRPGLIYNTKTVQLISQLAFGTISTSGNARQDMRYQLRPVGYDGGADFYLYASHYKASSGSSNAARRNVEAQAVRANADALGQGAHILYTGDFNIYGSSEPMWATLTAAGNGQAFDPVNRVGAWSNNSAFLDVHTQSPVTSSRYGGQITGGMDDRFDFQLTSGEFLDNEGLSYIAGSYHAFGNTGTHAFNGEITSGSAAVLASRLPGYTTVQAGAVLTALTQVSDHLPVVADYQLPAKMEVALGSAPPRVLVGAEASLQVTVRNVAPVVAAIGADELDYTVSASGALAGSGGGSVLALSAGGMHSLAMNTLLPGSRAGGVLVESGSQGVANGHFSGAVSYDVLDHARPAFAPGGGGDTLVLDLGVVSLDAVAVFTFPIYNLLSASGFTAGLDLDTVIVTGDGTLFLTSLGAFQDLEAGDSLPFTLQMLTGQAGDFSATYELRFSDEDLPGAADVGSLWLKVSGEVVAAPEPGSMALVALGAILVAVCARARKN